MCSCYVCGGEAKSVQPGQRGELWRWQGAVGKMVDGSGVVEQVVWVENSRLRRLQMPKRMPWSTSCGSRLSALARAHTVRPAGESVDISMVFIAREGSCV